MSLKDLNLIAQESKSSFQRYNNEEVLLNQEFKIEYTRIFERPSEKITFSQFTTLVKTNQELTITFPNQWFYIASYFVEYLLELKKYKNLYLEIFRNVPNSNDLVKQIKETREVPEIIKSKILNEIEDENDREYFQKFLSNYDWWYGSKTIDRADYYVSPILHLAKVVNASNSYIADLTLKLSEKPDLIELLKNSTLIKKPEELIIAENDPFQLNPFLEIIKEAGLEYDKKLICRFVSSLLTKPFVLLTGLSGSGKTKLAQAFAQWITINESQYVVVPVGADWTNREPLLGYPNALNKEEYVSPENGVLDLMIRAMQNIENTEEPTKPYFLILDEMNLSHVERYFADFLSTMESGDKIPLHKIGIDTLVIPPSIKLPKNLFIIGTVNIDETTYMFSPKVLDRANTIEFRLTEENLVKFIESDVKLNLDLLNAQGANMSNGFMRMALKETDKNLKPSETDLIKFFSELKKSGAEFGYRTANEIGRLMYMLKELGESGDNLLDIAIMQKLLPKLHGSRNRLSKVLPVLGGFCLTDNSKVKEDYLDKFLSNSLTEVELKADSNIKYKISFEKICRMYKNAVENGFASYAEA